MKNTKANEKHLLQKPLVVLAMAMVSCALWGSAFPSIKVGYRLFNIGSGEIGMQILFAGARFTCSGLLVILFGSVQNRKIVVPKRENLWCIAQIGFFQTVVQYSCFYVALAKISGVRASILDSVSAFFCMIVAVFIFRTEKPVARKFLGCLISILGVVYFYSNGDLLSGAVTFAGEGIMIISKIGYAMSSSLIHINSRREDPVIISGWQFFFGGIVLQIIGLLLGGHYTLPSLGALGIFVYLAFLSAVAYTVWGVLLKYNEVSKVSVYAFMTPIFGALLSAIILGEKDELGLRAILALAIISIGIFIVNVDPGKKEKA